VTGVIEARKFWSVVVLATLVSACGKNSDKQKSEKEAAAALPTLRLAAEDLHTLQSKSLASGPAITGSILPERRADLRAEVSAIVLAVMKENGDPVRQGELLVRLDDTAIRDTLSSAETAERSATQAYEQAQRQYERLVKLREGGLVSTQQLEDAEVRRNAAQSDRDAARSRAVAARQQLQRTQVRAPFDGIVSDRRASAGDTAQVGKELLKVIDPRSLRFEGYVSADHIGAVKPGQAVSFRIHGFANDDFAGRITRVNPAASAMTRQVEVLVRFDGGQQQPGIAGLYAEGRVETHHAAGLSLPAEVLVRNGDDTFAWRVNGTTLQKTRIQLGDRDARTGDHQIKSGLTAGDRLVRYPSSTLHDGQAVTLP
jgi:membrane fusion protein, multidrug efflux system